MSISVGHVVEVVVHGKANGQAIINVFHFKPNVPWDVGEEGSATVDGFLSNFVSYYRAQIRPLLSASYQVQKYSAVRIDQIDQFSRPDLTTYMGFHFGPYVELPGTIADDTGGIDNTGSIALPTFNAVSVALFTENRSRSGRGGKRFGPIAEAHTVDDQLSGAKREAWQDAIDILVATPIDASPGVADGNLEWCVFSRTRALKPANALGTPSAFASVIKRATVNPYLSHQSSRKANSAGA
jgi:hypothetical protein